MYRRALSSGRTKGGVCAAWRASGVGALRGSAERPSVRRVALPALPILGNFPRVFILRRTHIRSRIRAVLFSVPSPPRPPITATSLKPPFVADDLLFDRLRDAPPLPSTRRSQTHDVLLQPGAPQSRPHRPSAYRFLPVFGRHAGFSHYIIVRPRWSLFFFLTSSVGASFQWAPRPQLAP